MASRSRRTHSGRGASIIWFLVIAALIVAFFQIPSDPGTHGIIALLQSKAATVQAWVTGVTPKIKKNSTTIVKGGTQIFTGTGTSKPTNSANNNNSGNSNSTNTTNNSSPTKKQSQTSSIEKKLNTLKKANPNKTKYQATEWPYWSNVRTCWTVKEEVLAENAISGTLILEDILGNPTKNISDACSIISGKWVDSYDGKTLTNLNKLTVDHTISLNYVATHGGNAWSASKKQSYANNFSDSGQLVVVSEIEQKAKNNTTSNLWLPSNKSYQCQYAKNWVNVASTWGISVSSTDTSKLKTALTVCKKQ